MDKLTLARRRLQAIAETGGSLWEEDAKRLVDFMDTQDEEIATLRSKAEEDTALLGWIEEHALVWGYDPVRFAKSDPWYHIFERGLEGEPSLRESISKARGRLREQMPKEEGS